MVNGGPLPARSYAGHVVHNSFDDNGCLKKSAYYAKDQGASDLEGKDAEGDLCIEESQREPSVVEGIKDSTQTPVSLRILIVFLCFAKKKKKL